MPRIIKNTLLNYIPEIFDIEDNINQHRIFEYNNYNVGEGAIVYLCEREIRAKDNFALQFAIQKSQNLNLPLKIIYSQNFYTYTPKQIFIKKQIIQAKQIFEKSNIDFKITTQKPFEIIANINPSLLIIDFNPILNRDYLKNCKCKVYEIDGHNIIPARYISEKQEYNAATFRRKIYHNISSFLTEYNNLTEEISEADLVLQDFIKNKLPYYAKFKNDPSKNILSGLSKYLNLGFISSQKIAIEVIQSNASTEDKESFLEELIVRKELADNFCLYANNFKDFSSISNWAKLSLEEHKYDIRPYIYNIEELEFAKTHDEIWNISQKQLTNEGIIHGYLRMYWAKKILEWTNCPQEALEIAIYLNDKYAYDAPSPNGYVGILWAIGGLHDRAFADYPITGKIRRMSSSAIKKKFKPK